MNKNDLYRIPRERMIKEQLLAKGIKDKLVIHAMASLNRHEFVEKYLANYAYEDRTLPIGYGQTISQPSVVAFMSEALELKKNMTVLEVGTGCGYQAAVLHMMGACVFTVERIQELYFSTKKRFESMGMLKIRNRLSDGTLGWAEMAPFDRIIVAAGGPSIPDALLAQLAHNGIMIIPVGSTKGEQVLVRVRREKDKFFSKVLKPVAFVDLVGKNAW